MYKIILPSNWQSLSDSLPQLGEVVVLYARHGQIEQKVFTASALNFRAWYSHWSSATVQHPEFFPEGRFAADLRPMSETPEKDSEVLLLVRRSDSVQFVQAVAGRMFNGFGLPNCHGWECVTLYEERQLGWCYVTHKRPVGTSFENGPKDAPWRDGQGE